MTFRRRFGALSFLIAAVGACAAGACAVGQVDGGSPDGSSVARITPPLPTEGGAAEPAQPDSGDADDAGTLPDASAPEGGDDGGNDASTVVVTPPTVDGTVGAGEYGAHTNGQNQQQSTPGNAASTTWYMTWTDTHLYVAVTAATVTEGVVVYVDRAPRSPSTSGTNADGSLIGNPYDSTNAGALPFRADFVAYVKSGYNEYRTANGAGGWSAATAGALTVQAIGTTREIAIPWSAIGAGGRPSAFSWLGYATSSTGFVYGPMPSDNPQGAIGQSSTFVSFYKVTDATPGSGTKPFAVKGAP